MAPRTITDLLVSTVVAVLAIAVPTIVVARESFSTVQDIIKLEVTNETATFEIHCAWSRCRISLHSDDEPAQRKLINETILEPKRSYQRYTFQGLQPYTWYVVSKSVLAVTADGQETLIETGRFRTKMARPSASRFVEVVCLDKGRSALVRWSRPVPFYEKEPYRFVVKLEESKSGNSSAILFQVPAGTAAIQPHFIINNLTGDVTYQVSVQTSVLDANYRLTSSFSQPRTFHCGHSNVWDWLLMAVMVLITISALVSTAMAIVAIWRRRRQRHCQRYELEAKLSTDQVINPWSEVLL